MKEATVTMSLEDFDRQRDLATLGLRFQDLCKELHPLVKHPEVPASGILDTRTYRIPRKYFSDTVKAEEIVLRYL